MMHCMRRSLKPVRRDEATRRASHASKGTVRQVEGRQTTKTWQVYQFLCTYLDTLHSPTAAQIWCVEVGNALLHPLR